MDSNTRISGHDEHVQSSSPYRIGVAPRNLVLKSRQQVEHRLPPDSSCYLLLAFEVLFALQRLLLALLLHANQILGSQLALRT